MTTIDINSIPIEGTPERTAQQNAKLMQDLATFKTRPFLNREEKCNLGDYFSTWGTNKIFALFNYDRSGNFLPQAYHAPKEYLRMLYPIDEIMQHEKCGTLIIDREQYSPELRKLSYYIYMVDDELYEQYKEGQRFLGQTAPTYMFNQHKNDGVRIFKDYYALARHLRKQRYVTFCLGPRTTFYLRFFLYQLSIHTISDDYAFGEKQDATIANEVVNALQRHLAFNDKQSTSYTVDFMEDNYSQFRQLVQMYKMKLPEIKEFKNTTEIVRYNKRRFHAQTVYRVRNSKVNKLQQDGIYAYNHMIVVDNYCIFYIWDTRVITKIVPIEDVNFNDFVAGAMDNGMDLVCKANAEPYIREICEKLCLSFAIQMRD